MLMSSMKRRFGEAYWFCAATVLYLVLNLVLPANHSAQKSYHLSSTEYHVLIFIILLPYVVIWLIALYGYLQLKHYSAAIRSTKEGPAFLKLSKGARWLAWGLPIPGIISVVLNTIANSHPGFMGAATIINHYVTLAMALAAFSFMINASRSLLHRAKVEISAQGARTLILGAVIIGVVFCYLVFSNLSSLAAGASHNAYYLPVWLLVLSIIIPYLYAWFIGLLAAYDIWLVGKNTAGLLYRRGLQHMSWAIIIIVCAFIIIQYITSISLKPGKFSIGAAVAILYAVLLIYAAGFLLLARSSRKLRKLEEV